MVQPGLKRAQQAEAQVTTHVISLRPVRAPRAQRDGSAKSAKKRQKLLKIVESPTLDRVPERFGRYPAGSPVGVGHSTARLPLGDAVEVTLAAQVKLLVDQRG